MEPIVLRPGDGERIASGPARSTIIATSESTNGGFTITDTTIPPGFSGPPRHSHNELVDTFYVLEGTLTIVLGDDVVDAEPGTYVSVPPRNVHTFSNSGRSPTRFLNINAPGGWEKYLRDIADLMKDGPPDTDKWREVMSRHDFVPSE